MKHLPFRIFTLAIFIILIVPILVQDGMFMDGVLYAAVAKNQANGFGSFWFPMFADTWNKHGVHTFHEHPPLALGIQALFFKIFGNGIWVERFYTFLMAIGTAWLIHLNWKIIVRKSPQLISFSWLPILLWIIIPVAFWSFQNNMLENTMGLFVLGSTYFCFKFYFEKQNYQFLVWSSIFIFLATFCKGVPALFPIAIPFLYWISHRKIKFVNVIQHTVLLTSVLFFIYVLLLFYEPARESLIFYFENRLMGRIDSDPTVKSRFYILGRLIQELLPPLILAVLIFLFAKIKSKYFEPNREHQKNAILLLLIGFSGTLPLMLTMVQKGFYMVHALPYFGLGLALIIAPLLTGFLNKTNTKSNSLKFFHYFSIALLSGGILFSIFQIKKTKRDNDMLHDVYLLKSVLPKNTFVSVDKSIALDWNLKVYLMRNSEISVNNKLEEDYFLIEKKKENFTLNGFQKKEVGLLRYDLFIKTPFE